MEYRVSGPDVPWSHQMLLSRGNSRGSRFAGITANRLAALYEGDGAPV